MVIVFAILCNNSLVVLIYIKYHYQEITKVLQYAVDCNESLELVFAKKHLFDAWRQVTEVLFIACPLEILGNEKRDQLVLEISQELLSKVFHFKYFNILSYLCSFRYKIIPYHWQVFIIYEYNIMRNLLFDMFRTKVDQVHLFAQQSFIWIFALWTIICLLPQ